MMMSLLERPSQNPELSPEEFMAVDEKGSCATRVFYKNAVKLMSISSGLLGSIK